jgi:hypothetical protein
MNRYQIYIFTNLVPEIEALLRYFIRLLQNLKFIKFKFVNLPKDHIKQ